MTKLDFIRESRLYPWVVVRGAYLVCWRCAVHAKLPGGVDGEVPLHAMLSAVRDFVTVHRDCPARPGVKPRMEVQGGSEEPIEEGLG